MKIGIRTPSIKKSISSRTIEKFKRSIKKSTNPLYGKKGIGFITNPKSLSKIKYIIKWHLTFGIYLNR